MKKKSSRLIIQGLPHELGRRYHLDIQFPNGHMNLVPRLGTRDWCDPRPQLRAMPGRIDFILREMCGLTLKQERKVSPLIHSMGVRAYHLRVALNRNIPPTKVARALQLLDEAVIAALRADLDPDGDSGYNWFNNPGPVVEVARLEQSYMTNTFDPEGERHLVLAEADSTWVVRRMERHAQSWEHISFWDALRMPREQLKLVQELCLVEGITNFTMFPVLRGSELWLHKGLAWTWEAVNVVMVERKLTYADVGSATA